MFSHWFNTATPPYQNT